MENSTNKNTLKLKTVLFAFIGLSVVGQLYLPIPIINQLSQEFGASLSNSATLIPAFGYSYAVGFLFFGPLSDKLGKKTILLFGMITLFLLTLLIVTASQYILIIRALQGFFAASYPPLILAYIGQHFPNKHKKLAISAMAFAFLSAVILSQLFVIYIAQSSFVLAQQILGAIYILAIVIIGFGIKNEKRKTQTKLLEFIANIPKVILNNQLIRYYLLSFFVLLIFVGFYLILASKLTLSEMQLFAIRLGGFPAMLFTFTAPKLTDTIGANKVIALAFLLQIIGLLIAGLSATPIGIAPNHFYGFLSASFLLATATALLVPTLIASISQTASSNEKSTAIALYTFILFCGASSAPFVINVLSKYLESKGLLYTLLFTCTILLLIDAKNLFNFREI